MPHKKLKSSTHKPSQGNSHPKQLRTVQEYEALFKNSNVQAFLMTIRDGEGTLGARGFYKHYGGGFLATLNEQPLLGEIWRWGKKDHHPSSAVGAFMFLNSKDNPRWPEIAARYHFKDFSEINQIIGAEYLIDKKSAIEDILDGDIISAIKRTKGTWTSLPDGKQQRLTMQAALEFYRSQGGVLSESNLQYIPILNWKNPAVDPSLNKQQQSIPEFIDILMGKLGNTFGNEQKKSGAKRADGSGPVISNLSVGDTAIAAADKNSLAEKLSRWDNWQESFNKLVNSSDTLFNAGTSTFPSISEQTAGKLQALHQINNPITYSNGKSHQATIPNLNIGTETPWVDTNTNVNYKKPDLRKNAILRGNKLLDTPYSRQKHLQKSSFKKNSDALPTKSEKWPNDRSIRSSHMPSGQMTTINLNKPLIENFIVNTREIKDGLSDIKRKVEEVLLEILNSANVIQ